MRELLTRRPDNTAARGNLGMLLLARDDPEGVEHIEEAMGSEPDLIIPGLEALARFARNQGRQDEAEVYMRRLSESYDALYEYQLERQMLGENDTFIPHDLSPAWADWIHQTLSAEPAIQEAYLVRKEVHHFPESSCYILSLVSDELTGKHVAAILDQIDLPAFLFVVDHHRVPGILRSRIEEASGRPFYSDSSLFPDSTIKPSVDSAATTSEIARQTPKPRSDRIALRILLGIGAFYAVMALVALILKLRGAG